MLLPLMPQDIPESEKLQLAKTLWVEGDWEALIALTNDIDDEVDNTQLRTYLAAAYAQLGDCANAIATWKLIEQGEDKAQNERLWRYRVLLSGVHNSLARARAVNGELQKGQEHWYNSLGLIIYGPQQRLATQVRAKQQLKQLGLPQSWAVKSFEKSDVQHNVPYGLLAELHEQCPNDPAILIGLAESVQRQGLFDEAIRHWQTLASILQENMPQTYYDRLDEAYQNQKSFPQGTDEEERLIGDGDKHEFLKKLHQKFKPNLYLEIGVQTGKSLLLAECEAIGVDPMPRPNIKLQKNHTILRMTSDEFFKNHAHQYLMHSPDLAFIDGMHLFEYALRDFINLERFSSSNTVVVIDDIFPGHPAQAERERRTRAWTGDIWKLIEIFEKYRPDLNIAKINIYPTGLLVISNLDSSNKELEYNYTDLVKLWAEKELDPKWVMRSNTIVAEEFLNGHCVFNHRGW
ncbi:class I SAM-dependent methyltransferase [Vreelandella sp. F11]|uniref:class I SAM-dependent methyltransferase n=1 Tax=Vreelandella sp. F11 TaxID=3394751 RepID=UPI0036DE6798